MEGVIASAQEFLSDARAVEAALQVDRKRAQSLRSLRDAFEAFRDRGESMQRLASRIKQPLWEVCAASRGGAPRNLWGFVNEDERQFPERFAGAAPRVRELDLDEVFRGYLRDQPTRDKDRVQQLLAFGEFVASLDSRGDERDPRLGVGPAANFLTFAWHCLSEGSQPVFLYASNRAIKAIAESGGLGPEATVQGRDLEQRFRTFYRVARTLESALEKAPREMRPAWAVEHALAYVLDTIEGTRTLASEEPGSSGMWRPRARNELKEELDGRRGPMIVPGMAPRPKRSRSGSEPSDAELDALIQRDPTSLTPHTAQKRDRFMEISKKRVVHAKTRMFEESGLDLIDALPKDRSVDSDPYFKRKSPRHDEVRREEEARAATSKKAEQRRVKKLIEQQERVRRLNEVLDEPGAGPSILAPASSELDALALDDDDLLDDDDADGSAPAIESPATSGSPTRVLRYEADTQSQKALDELLHEFRGEVIEASRTGADQPTSSVAGPLAHDLHLEDDLVQDMIAALEERGRLLLLGPAGAGKTFVARRLAIHLAGHTDRVLHVRFHPDLSYGDLIDGPAGAGIVRAHCELAQRDRGQPHVLVLDEIDRGDAARSLGEFLGALSERGQHVRLARSGASFHVPRNLLVLATARELPHDPALVGRFPIVRQPADSEVLRRFLSHCRPSLRWVADMHASLNERIAAQGHPARVGHGFLMDADLDVARLQRIWGREILPLLEGHGISAGGLDYGTLRP